MVEKTLIKTCTGKNQFILHQIYVWWHFSLATAISCVFSNQATNLLTIALLPREEANEDIALAEDLLKTTTASAGLRVHGSLFVHIYMSSNDVLSLCAIIFFPFFILTPLGAPRQGGAPL